MLQQIQTAYIQHRWMKTAALCALIVCATLLYLCSGGFPPWAWRFLWQTLPQISPLWAAHGSAIVAPLAGLLLLSLALLLLWILLTSMAIRVGIHWWQDFHTRASFASDLQEAEEMAEAFSLAEQASQYQEEQLQQASQDLALRATISQRATYALGRAERLARDLSVPLPAAVPDYPRPINYQQTARQAPIAPSPSLRRDQLRLVPPPQPAAPFTARAYRPRPDIEQYDTLPPRSDELDEEEVETLEDASALEASAASIPQADPEEEVAPDEEQIFALQDELLLASVQPGNERIRLVVGVGLDPGLVRRDLPNEDSLFAIQGNRVTENGTDAVGLFVVADGMGGHADGQEASNIAIRTMSDLVVPMVMRGTESDQNFLELLKEAAHKANLAIYQRNRQRSQMMGTTLTAALVVGDTAYIVNVGDSRTYRYRKGGELKPITRDHSAVAQLVERGLITPEEVYTHPKRNEIYRCLGERGSLDLDAYVEKLRCGDVLMLCSDGLWEMVRDRDMQKILEASASHPSQASSLLVQAALGRGGADNISVVVVYMARAEQQ